MTTDPFPLTTVLLAWPAGPGSSPASRRAIQQWRSDPLLACYSTPGEAAVALRAAYPTGAAVLIGALAARPEPEAHLAVLAGLAPRLARVTRRWASAGLSAADRSDLEADLVAGCWEGLRTLPAGCDPDRLVDQAWQRASGRRRTLRARAARQAPLATLETTQAAWPRTAVEQVAVELGEAVAARRLSVTGARVLAATAAGYPTRQTAQALGTTPVAIRACRSRTLRRLAATGRSEVA